MVSTTGISEAEWEVIKVLWTRGPLTSGQLVEAMSAESRWRPRTIKTLLARLVKKGAVSCGVQEKRYVYRATITRQAAARREARSFLARVFDGALAPALVTFLKETDLSPADVEQLKAILEREGRR